MKRCAGSPAAGYFSEHHRQQSGLQRVFEMVQKVAEQIATSYHRRNRHRKRLIAKAIHNLSRRRDNLSSHQLRLPGRRSPGERALRTCQGSFTGAVAPVKGSLRLPMEEHLSHEIAETSPSFQVKLRVFYKKGIHAVGEPILSMWILDHSRHHRDIEKAVERREFRQDLSTV